MSTSPMRGHVDIVVLTCALAACAPPPHTAAPRTPGTPQRAAAPALLPIPGFLTSARIAALDDGALVIDADSGLLVRTASDGAVQAHRAIGRGAGTLAHDPRRGAVFVADRGGDHIIVADASSLAVQRSWETPAEPFGVALTPDTKTLLVSTIADRTLVAYDVDTGAERWRVPLSREARGIAVSPDGTRALVTVGNGALDVVALDATHAVTSIELDLACDQCAEGDAFARGSAVLFLDEHRAIASFQRMVPRALDGRDTSRYSGGRSPPVTQHLAFLTFTAETTQVVAQIVANQPRSLLWDRTRDALYIAGLSSDTLLRLNRLTRATTHETEDAATHFAIRDGDACGPDGLAQDARGTLYIWCAFTRSIVRVPITEPEAGVRESPPVAMSALSAVEHQGMVLFDTVRGSINRDGALACSSCHGEGRSDGMSWKIRASVLQTPILAGRALRSEPYKWDGSDKTLANSVASTVHRLGGSGLTAEESGALLAYLAAMPRPRIPTLDRAAVARGKAVFDGDGDCADCHRGAELTDRKRYTFTSSLAQADTPSLIGLAASAPYYHDGSAPTLEALVDGQGAVHGMADFGTLTAAQRADLATYLASL